MTDLGLLERHALAADHAATGLVPLDSVRALADDLLTRLGEAKPLQVMDTSDLGWFPLPQLCHRNVRQWLQANPGHKRVVGYLVYDFIDAIGFARLWAHSAIETPAGELLEITPTLSGSVQPFLRHTGSPDEFFGS